MSKAADKANVSGLTTTIFVMQGGGMAAHGINCCGKPQGCTREDPSCVFLEYPYKRWARGEISLIELNTINPPRLESNE